MKLIVLALVVTVLGVSLGAQGLPKPTAEITRFEVSAISLRDVTFLFELAVGAGGEPGGLGLVGHGGGGRRRSPAPGSFMRGRGSRPQSRCGQRHNGRLG